MSMDVRGLIEINDESLLQEEVSETILLTEQPGHTLVEDNSTYRIENVTEEIGLSESIEEFAIFIDSDSELITVEDENLFLLVEDTVHDVTLVEENIVLAEQHGSVFVSNYYETPGGRIYVQPNEPIEASAVDYLWIQTGLPGDGFTFWFNDVV